MEKMKTVFRVDHGGTNLAENIVNPESEWVVNGEGVATLKEDGTSCMYDGFQWWTRYTVKKKKGKLRKLENFIACSEPDNITGKQVGWVPVNADNDAHKFHMEAIANIENPEKGTYELVGPKVQGGKSGYTEHMMVKHGATVLENVPRTFEGLEQYLQDNCIEGVVFHHSDGRMAKIRRKDFGIEW